MTTPFSKILIANRGEIAIRIMRACREMSIPTVAVYSEADAHALHVRLASEAVFIGAASAKDSYLNSARIIDAAFKTGCQAIHPGYGFLSENADFAAAVQAAGLKFIGPPVEAIRAMGLKTEALKLMQAAGVPTVPGYQGDSDFQQAADRIGYPVLVKAAAGGGGKGMRIVRAISELTDALETAQREAQNAFADGRVFLEKYIENARHIEFQVFGDEQGHVVHLFERECSIQRRHQKIIEETPSPLLDADLRSRMGAAAVEAARAVGYVNAGTVEFIVDADRNFYFLEMNTRLQVEHPITEWVTGLDLVKLQIEIAAGNPLPFTQNEVSQRGHAIECRVYAEDPANGFLPAIGTADRIVEPSGPGVRVDSGLASGDEVSIHYDPMIAKLSVYGMDRQDAIQRMRRALADYVIDGLTTNLAFLAAVIDHPVFVAGEATTGFIEKYFGEWKPGLTSPPAPLSVYREGESIQTRLADVGDPWSRADGFRIGGGVTYTVGKTNKTTPKRNSGQGENTLVAAMPGQVTRILIAEGDSVTRGQTLLLLEAMKMEIKMTAPRDATVKKLLCTAGQIVERGQTLVELI